MRRIVFSSIIALIVTGLLTAGYFFYRRYSGDVAEAIRAVPPDAAFVVECRNAQTALINLRQTDYWKANVGNAALTPAKKIGESLVHIDSVFSADAGYSSLWKQQPIVISAHITKADDFDWLFLFEVPRGTDERDAADLLKKIIASPGVSSRHEYEGVYINEMMQNGGRSFSFALSKGLLMCSYTSFLVEDAIRQLKNGSSLKDNKSFYTVYKTAGKNTDADIYFNYNSFSRFFGIFTNQDAAGMLAFSSTLGEWSEADVRFNPASVLLSGISSVKDSGQLLAVLKNQQPQEMKIATILPARTSYLFHVGISDPKSFFERLQKSAFAAGEVKNNEPGAGSKEKNTFFHKAGSQQAKRGKSSSASQPAALNALLTSWVGNEIALVITESNTANYSNNTFACIAARDTLEAMRALKEVCVVMEPVKGTPCKTEFYHGHEIGLIKSDGLLKTFYGKLFEGMQKNYFTSVGSYMVFANQASSLRTFIDDADNKKTLSSDNSFRQVLANCEASSNVFVYLDFPRMFNVMKSLCSDAMLHAFKDENNWINPSHAGFEAMAIQYSNKGDLIANHFVLQYSEEAKKGPTLVWSAECDTSIHAGPQVVNDGSNNLFMIQDDANRLYLFDAGGQLLWKKQMDEKITGDIHSIDFFHNGTRQFLFNTSSYLYLIDKAGAYIGNFPIRLPSPAGKGCTVADFDNNQEYKIFIACTNQVIYAYEMNGKAMNGWLFNKPVGNITLPVKYFKVNEKDYLLIGTTDGKIVLLDRRGTLRAKAGEKIVISPLSAVQEADTNDAAPAHVVFADTSGTVYALYTNGLVKKIFANHFSQPVFFDMADINRDGKADYILFANNTLSVQADSTILFTHEFRETPQGLSVFVSGGMVGSIAPSSNEITVYNADGTFYPGFPVKGNTPFIVTTLNNDGKKYLAAGSTDGNLYLYVLE